MRCQDIRSTLLGVAIKLVYDPVLRHLQLISVKAQETHECTPKSSGVSMNVDHDCSLLNGCAPSICTFLI